MKLHFLIVALALAKNALSSSSSSGLDLLASVTVSSSATDFGLPCILTPQEENVIQEITTMLTQAKPILEADLQKLRSIYADPKIYLFTLLKVSSGSNFDSFHFDFKFPIFKEIDLLTSELPDVTGLLDLSALSLLTHQALGVIACISGNLSLLKRLVESKYFDLNAGYWFNDFYGNAIVFLKDHPQCLDFAIKSGLDLEKPVKSDKGNTYSGHEFLLTKENSESLEPVKISGTKRPLEQSSDTRTEKAKEHIPVVSMSEEDEFTFKRLIYVNMYALKGFEHEYLNLIHTLLQKYGHLVARQLLEAKPRLMELEGFVPMLINALSEDLDKLAEILTLHPSKICKDLDSIRNLLGDAVKFSRFLFEMLKFGSKSLFIKPYFKSLLAFEDESMFREGLATHDYSTLPEYLLTGIAHYAVLYNEPYVLRKVVEVNPKALERKFIIGFLVPIYAHVKNAEMLKLLFDLNVHVMPTIRKAEGNVPTLYHLLSMKKPEITEIVMARTWHNADITNSFHYAQRIKNLEMVSLLSSMKKN